MDIVNLRPDDEKSIHQAASLLVHYFPWPSGYPALETALEEVRESLQEGRISCIAVEEGKFLGWIGGSLNIRVTYGSSTPWWCNPTVAAKV